MAFNIQSALQGMAGSLKGAYQGQIYADQLKALMKKEAEQRAQRDFIMHKYQQEQINEQQKQELAQKKYLFDVAQEQGKQIGELGYVSPLAGSPMEESKYGNLLQTAGLADGRGFSFPTGAGQGIPMIPKPETPITKYQGSMLDIAQQRLKLEKTGAGRQKTQYDIWADQQPPGSDTSIEAYKKKTAQSVLNPKSIKYHDIPPKAITRFENWEKTYKDNPYRTFVDWIGRTQSIPDEYKAQAIKQAKTYWGVE